MKARLPGAVRGGADDEEEAACTRTNDLPQPWGLERALAANPLSLEPRTTRVVHVPAGRDPESFACRVTVAKAKSVRDPMRIDEVKCPDPAGWVAEESRAGSAGGRKGEDRMERAVNGGSTVCSPTGLSERAA